VLPYCKDQCEPHYRELSGALFIRLIIRTFQLIFLVKIVFFSHNKSANVVFQPIFQRSRTGYASDLALSLMLAVKLYRGTSFALTNYRDLGTHQTSPSPCHVSSRHSPCILLSSGCVPFLQNSKNFTRFLVTSNI
jgi:hypothetical protein